MAYEMLVGLHVTDEEKYEEYRKNMKPILSEYKGGFSYDFKISEVLISKTDNDINRVFTIHFPDRATMDSFFSNSNYLDVKRKYYEAAVASTTILSSYTKDS